MRNEADRDRRECFFAEALDRDFTEALDRHFRLDGDAETVLCNDLLDGVRMHVNWRRVARALLNHFTLPMALASVGRSPESRRAPEWHGAVN